MKDLKSIRLDKELTQQQAAGIVGISLRSYKSYENDLDKRGNLKYNYIYEKLSQINPIDEEHGIVDLEYISRKCSEIFDKYKINFCYLFGSYAKGKAKDDSDVDLLISTEIKGLKFYGLVEEIRNSLHKKVDVIEVAGLKDNVELLEEILKDGIKIYG
ncbi:nucleotidyltransferase domain-containing protein [Catonella massiliensis]|uniref:Nucleotidyltransferase domain-containing protein n=1 Tax=Catonella massiliensis TaxID=2799636 RepID=A0ABS1IZ68_9FIRM|nr:nucleotidyltransferase domain-containing protein [Catonella massiliensis]MBK5897185.1 nucleotidyltransferase domain-containing protein [Catonella massiliensis]